MYIGIHNVSWHQTLKYKYANNSRQTKVLLHDPEMHGEEYHVPELELRVTSRNEIGSNQQALRHYLNRFPRLPLVLLAAKSVEKSIKAKTSHPMLYEEVDRIPK